MADAVHIAADDIRLPGNSIGLAHIVFFGVAAAAPLTTLGGAATDGFTFGKGTGVPGIFLVTRPMLSTVGLRIGIAAMILSLPLLVGASIGRSRASPSWPASGSTSPRRRSSGPNRRSQVRSAASSTRSDRDRRTGTSTDVLRITKGEYR